MSTPYFSRNCYFEYKSLSGLRYGMCHLRAALVGVLPIQLFSLNKLLKSLGNSWGILQDSTSKHHINVTVVELQSILNTI